MGSYLLSSVTLATLVVTLLLSIPPTCSTSRQALNHPKAKMGFRVPLQRVDSGKNLTKIERLHRAIKRDKHKLHRLNDAMSLRSASSLVEVRSPVHAGVNEFLMQLAIGTPPVSYSAIVDTGSDLIWTKCEPCVDCFHQPARLFDPKNSSSFSKLSCSSNLCKALDDSSCGNNGCEYVYNYGDSSSTQGTMATETFTFDKVKVPNIGFGCGDDNEGFEQSAGLVGLGRGPLSLVSQLNEPKFSYCLTSLDDEESTSTLLIGSSASVKNSSSGAIITTPLIFNPAYPSFYYISLKGITVGDVNIPVDGSIFEIDGNGNGGTIIDSGTTLTYLEENVFHKVTEEFSSQIKLPVDFDNDTDFDFCFVLPSDKGNIDIPKLVFHFEGASLELPTENYMIVDWEGGTACLAMGSASEVGLMSVFGIVQQQNMVVLYDQEKETLSFMPTQCNKL